MVDVIKRGDGSGENEPMLEGPILAARGNKDNFDMAAAASRSYQSLLQQGIQLPQPGAPVPVMYPGGHLSDPRPGESPSGAFYDGGAVKTAPVTQGMHADPKASDVNVGSPGITGNNVHEQQDLGFDKPNYPIGAQAGGLRNGRI